MLLFFMKLSHVAYSDHYLLFFFFLRGYNEKKIESNISSEIFQVILDEAKESYAEGIVHELPSNTADELESNLDQIAQWLEDWQSRH